MPNERPRLAQVLLIRLRGILSTRPIKIRSPGRDPPEAHRDGFLGPKPGKPSRAAREGRERSVERAGSLRRESVHLMRWEVCVPLAPAPARGK